METQITKLVTQISTPAKDPPNPHGPSKPDSPIAQSPRATTPPLQLEHAAEEAKERAELATPEKKEPEEEVWEEENEDDDMKDQIRSITIDNEFAGDLADTPYGRWATAALKPEDGVALPVGADLVLPYEGTFPKIEFNHELVSSSGSITTIQRPRLIQVKKMPDKAFECPLSFIYNSACSWCSPERTRECDKLKLDTTVGTGPHFSFISKLKITHFTDEALAPTLPDLAEGEFTHPYVLFCTMTSSRQARRFRRSFFREKMFCHWTHVLAALSVIRASNLGETEEQRKEATRQLLNNEVANELAAKLWQTCQLWDATSLRIIVVGLLLWNARPTGSKFRKKRGKGSRRSVTQ